MGQVFWRDFAYNNRRFRLRMATGNVGDADAREFARLLSGSMVEIEVGTGESKRRWNIHKNLLMHHSEVLEDQLDDSQDDKLELPEFDPTGFELLVKWLYQGKLDDVSDASGAEQQYEHAVSCHKLYQLCDRFGMEQLKNVAMDQYRRGLNMSELVPDAGEINEIYRQSPPGSPWRKLTTRIAARQIMDPHSHHDVSSYRECFVDNPDFAIELVTAIKEGTGGVLLDDPTEEGQECEYHDHESLPDCHVSGKSKAKQDLKTQAPYPVPKSSNSDPHDQPDHPTHPLRPSLLIPSPHPRQSRLQNGTSRRPDSLRRRLTSPASSTTEMSVEMAIGKPRSPAAEKAGMVFSRISPIGNHHHQLSPVQTMLQVQGVHRQNLGGEGHPIDSLAQSIHSTPSLSDSKGDVSSDTQDGATAPSRQAGTEEKGTRSSGIWEWARLGRMGIISRKSEPAGFLTTTKSATMAVNGALQGSRVIEYPDSLYNFRVSPRATTTLDASTALQAHTTLIKADGLGISNAIFDPPFFSQTKGSSDDLVASSSVTGTPSPAMLRSTDIGAFDESEPSHSPPPAPSPQPSRKKDTKSAAQNSVKVQESNLQQKTKSISSSTVNNVNNGTEIKPKKRLATNSITSSPLPEKQQPSPPSTPVSHTQKSESRTTPRPIPKYKIALAGHLLSPARSSSS